LNFAPAFFNFSIDSKIVFFTHLSIPSSKYSLGIQNVNQERSFVSQISSFIISTQGIEVFSLESSQFIILYKIAESFTVFVKVQGQSKLEAIAITQNLEFLP
jgi:hypothetical protein